METVGKNPSQWENCLEGGMDQGCSSLWHWGMWFRGVMVGLDWITDLFQPEWLYDYNSPSAKSLPEPQGAEGLGKGIPTPQIHLCHIIQVILDQRSQDLDWKMSRAFAVHFKQPKTELIAVVTAGGNAIGPDTLKPHEAAFSVALPPLAGKHSRCWDLYA